MKCTGTHSTNECTKSAENSKAKCDHCGKDHPANYRGYEDAKELQTSAKKASGLES